jgi:hypothetical protein
MMTCNQKIKYFSFIIFTLSAFGLVAADLGIKGRELLYSHFLVTITNASVLDLSFCNLVVSIPKKFIIYRPLIRNMDSRYFHAFVVTVGLILGLGLGVAPTQNQVYAQGNTTEGNEEVSGSAEDENVTNQQVQELNDAGSKKDKIEPTIVSRSPNVNTVSIPVNTNIEVKFSEPVKNSSISSSTFILKTSADEKEIPGLVLLDSDKTIATFTPISALSPLQSYTVTLTSGIKDLAGNRLNSEKWSFTTEGNPSVSDGGSTTGASDLENKTAPGGGVGILNEAAQYEDSKLLDRLLPILYQKIDINTIIAKADGKKLLEKVLPYLDVNVTTRVQKSGIKNIEPPPTLKAGVRMSQLIEVKCSQDEFMISGGYEMRSGGLAIARASVPWKDGNEWILTTEFDSPGTYQGYAMCMKVKVGILAPGSGKVIPGKSDRLGIITKPGSGILKGLGP